MNSTINNIQLSLPVSRYLSIWLWACCAASFIIIYYLSIPLWVKGLLALLILSYTVYSYKNKAECSLSGSYVKIQQLRGLEWLLTTKNNSVVAATLRADTFVTSWLIILRLEKNTFPRTISIPLFASEVGAHTWRGLNIYLRWHVQRHLKETLI